MARILKTTTTLLLSLAALLPAARAIPLGSVMQRTPIFTPRHGCVAAHIAATLLARFVPDGR